MTTRLVVLIAEDPTGRRHAADVVHVADALPWSPVEALCGTPAEVATPTRIVLEDRTGEVDCPECAGLLEAAR